MPARGSGYAILKWVTSYPGNRARCLPVVAGAARLRRRDGWELVAILDCTAVTSLRTAASAGVVGCGVNGSRAGRCLAAVGYSEGVCTDVRPEAADALADELGWSAGSLAAALSATSSSVSTAARLR